MAFAKGSRAEVGYIAEVTLGTTPATPALVLVSMTGFKPELKKDGNASGDIRSDRQIVDYRHGRKSVSVGLDVSLKHGVYDDFLESALFGSWAANVLKCGTTQKGFSLEAAFRDIGRFHVYKGCIVNTFSMSVKPEGEVTGSFNFVGLDMANAATSVDADTYTVPAVKRAFDGFTGSILEGGGAIASITGIDLSLENGLEAAKTLFTDSATEMFEGRSNLTGTVSAYFEDDAMLQKFIDETPSSIEFTLTDPDGNTLTFLLPRVIYTGGTPGISGESGIVISLPFQATYDETEATNLKITRSA